MLGKKVMQRGFAGLLSLIPLLLSILLIVIDGTLMNVSMSYVSKDLNIGLTSLQTLITFYSLITGALLLVAGRIGDKFGRKKVFQVGALFFAIGSFISGMSKSAFQLFIGWSLFEGIGAALMMPNSTSIIVDTFKGDKKKLAFGLWGATASVGAALGPIVGGFVTTYFSWRYAFWAQVILAGLVFALATVLKESRPSRGYKVDFWGAVLSVVWVALFIYAVLKANDWGWITAKESWGFENFSVEAGGISKTLVLILLAFLFLALFVYVERKHNNPIVDFEIFKNKQFTLGILVTLALNLAQSGVFFVFPVYFQVLFNLTALQTGLILLPITIGVFIASIFGSRSRLSDSLFISVGLAVDVIALIFLREWGFSLENPIDKVAWPLLLGFLGLGIGMGLVMARLTNLVMSAIAPKLAGMASGINSTIRRVAASLGTAFMGSIFLQFFTSTQAFKDLKSSPFIRRVGEEDPMILGRIIRMHVPQAWSLFESAILESIKGVVMISIALFIIVLFGFIIFAKITGVSERQDRGKLSFNS